MNIDIQDLAKLAREMAMMLKPREVILHDHELTEADFAQIEELDFYKRALETASIEWNRPMSTADRIQMIGRCYLEETLPILGGRAVNPAESFANVIDATKVLTQISGISGSIDRSVPGAAAEKFIIQINLGADVERFEKTIEQQPSQPILPKADDGPAQ